VRPPRGEGRAYALAARPDLVAVRPPRLLGVLVFDTLPGLGMLVDLADELERQGIRLALARRDGRDSIRVGAGVSPLATYPTVDAAVEELRGNAT
jgi:hypothetical protein